MIFKRRKKDICLRCGCFLEKIAENKNNKNKYCPVCDDIILFKEVKK